MKLPLRLHRNIQDSTIDILDANGKMIITGLNEYESEDLVKKVNLYDRLAFELLSARSIIELLLKDNNYLFCCEDKIDQIDKILNYVKEKCV